MPNTLTDRFDLRALLETSRLLSSSLELDFVLGNLLLTAMSKLFVTRGLVLLEDPLAGQHRVAAVKGMAKLKPGDHLPVAAAPEAVAEGEAIPEPLRERGVALLLPIRYHERTIGLVGLGAKAVGGAFSTDERAFVDSLVHMSATAVHNAQMVEELQAANTDLGQKVQQLNTLFDLSQEFNRTLDAEHSVRLLSLALMGQLLVRRYAFVLRQDTGFELAAARGADGLDAEALDRLADLKRLVLLDEDAPPEWADLREHGFRLLLPLRMQEETRGALLLGPKPAERPYEPDEVEFLQALGALALTSVENARLVASRIEKERLEEELRLARQIQERLLPQDLPKPEGVGLAALNLPSRYVAGDYYDVLALDADRVLVVIADVSGKGVGASLLMSNLQACIQVLRHSLKAASITLAEATARVNAVVHRNTGLTTFITFCWGVYDRRDGRLRYVNAGHNPPMLLRQNGELELLEEGGVLLGVLAGAPYAEGEVTLAPGDTVVLFTDGITEAWSATDADDEYGEARLEAAIRQHRQDSAEAILAAVRADVRAHTGGGSLDDDLTIAVLKREA